MDARWILGLAWLVLGAGSVAASAPAGPNSGSGRTDAVQTDASKPISPATTVTIHRCVDARGHVSLQDDPCAAGSHDATLEMVRPQDPPPSARPKPLPAVKLVELPPPPPPRELIPPPPMYKCTTYDGNQRFSESYDPNPRCEPLVIYYPYPNNLTPAQALSCRWVEDSCVRLSDETACDRWVAMRKEAQSALQRSFSDTSVYRKSELKRISQIVNESCP